MAGIETRVARIAEATLAEQQFVTPIDVLVGLGWLAQSNVDRWQQGPLHPLDICIGVDDTKTAAALDALRRWAQDERPRTLRHRLPRTPVHRHGDPATERSFGTRWATAEQHAPAIPPQRPRDLIVVSPLKAWTCDSCGDTGDLLVKTDAGALCLDCADLGHLVFLPSGDAALTRRAKKASRLSCRGRPLEQEPQTL